MENQEYELYHYGVLGMKWGVRRASKYRNKASGFVRGSDKEFEKAQKYDSKKRSSRNVKRTVQTAANALESARKAKTSSDMADRTLAKHEDKYQKKVAKNANKIAKAKSKGKVSPEKLQKMKDKADKFVKTHDELMKKVPKDISAQADKHYARVDSFVRDIDRRINLSYGLSGDRYAER